LNLDRYVRNSPSNGTDPSGLEDRENVDEELCKARDELFKAVKGRHPSGRKITPEQAALRLLLLESIRDSAFKLPNRSQGRPEFPLETLQSAADYQLLWSRFAPSDICVWCRPLSRIFPIKANIDLADNDRAKLAKLDKVLKTFWTTPKGKNPFLKDTPGEPKDNLKGFQKNELLPGDQIWFENPYARLISDAEWESQGFRGEEGSNVFYLGDGKIMNIYRSHPIKTIEEKQRSMMGSDWPSVDYAVAEQKKNPKAYEKMIRDLDREYKDQYTKLEMFPVHREVFRVVVQREPEVFLAEGY
jgi:hypothetical protein